MPRTLMASRFRAAFAVISATLGLVAAAKDLVSPALTLYGSLLILGLLVLVGIIFATQGFLWASAKQIIRQLSGYWPTLYSIGLTLVAVLWIPVGVGLARSEPTLCADDIKTTVSFPLISFTSQRDGNPEIYTMAPQVGAKATNLTQSAEDDWASTWSSDCERLAFVSYRDGNAELYTMTYDGSDVTRITTTAGSNAATDEHFPAWSPTGKQLAFNFGPDLHRDIYIMDINGHNRINLTNGQGDNLAPAWSPDGSKIAYHSCREAGCDIFVMDAQTATILDQLTTDPAEDSFPAWSPDSRRIAFVSDRTGNHEIWIMFSNGSNQVQITNNGTSNFAPSWSPDDNSIVFHSLKDADPNHPQNNELYVVAVDSSQETRLTNTVASDSDPSWSSACGPKSAQKQDSFAGMSRCEALALRTYP